FYDQSLGNLTYTQVVTKVITLPRARNYYNFSDYPTNTIFRGNAGQTLLNDAITELQKDTSFDFTQLSVDENGFVLATNIFFAGPDSGRWSRGLWPHMSGLGGMGRNVGTAANPIRINAYQITNLNNTRPVLSVFCHENGHLLLGYPDLYDYEGDSAGAGSHCLMAYGGSNNGGRTPSPINVFFKDMSGWADVTNMTPSQFRTISLTTTGNKAVRVRKPGTPTEYFMVENRGTGDRWADHSVAKGIAIWHIDETKNGNSEQDMTEESHFQVSLEQADGQFHLERNLNAGDANDLFSLSTPNFNTRTVPNSRWWNGRSSGVEIKVLTAVGASTDVLIGSVLPNTIVLDSPKGGETIYPGTKFKIHWRANIKGDVRIDLLKGTKVHSMISSVEKNDGEFEWQVPSGLEKGDDYKVRIRSLTNTVPAVITSATPFTVTDATFPVAKSMPHGWFKPASADSGWMVTNSGAYEGTHSLVTKKTGDGRVAGIAYRSNFKEGRVGFYMRVSSEQGFDYGRFYINGVRQSTDPIKGGLGLSGNTGWQYFSFPVTAGTHTFMWTFEKDDSYGGLQDKVWLDVERRTSAFKTPQGVQWLTVP
ncbi:MAG: M6 family metalloprotease domain-containing protein, partial [Verrucomicrobiaceae bacterium]